MTENMQKFARLLSENPDVQAQFQCITEAAANELAQGIIALAEKNGIELMEADLEVESSEDLSDDELDGVAGGYCFFGGTNVDCFLTGTISTSVCVASGTITF